jgi:hypothetical protein
MSEERLAQLLAGFLPDAKQQGAQTAMRSQEAGKAICEEGSSGGSNSQ